VQQLGASTLYYQCEQCGNWGETLIASTNSAGSVVEQLSLAALMVIITRLFG
jgi:hypothetical protein